MLVKPLVRPICRAIAGRPTASLGGGLTNTVDLFVIVGQSNAEGRGNSALSPASPSGLYISGTTISGPLADPVGGAQTGSMWPAFANEWAARTRNRSAFVESATGSTVLLPNQAGSNWSPSGTLRGAAVTAANNAITAINSSNYTLGSVHFIWCQGETDAANINGTTITAALYEQALEDLAAYFKTNVPSMAAMHVVQTGGFATAGGAVESMTTRSINQEAIRAAQRNACNDSSILSMAYSGAYSFLSTGKMGDSQHFNQNGLNQAGKCAARQIASPSSPASISPFISSSNYVDPAYALKSSRTASHTTASGTTILIVAVAIPRPESAAGIVAPTVTFGGVPMRIAATTTRSSVSPDGAALCAIYYIDEASYGSSLSGVTADVVVTAPVVHNLINWTAINAKDVVVPEAEGGAYLSASDTGTSTINTYQPTLIVTAAASSSSSSSPLTATMTGATELMDAGLTNPGLTRSGQTAIGYSVEASPVVGKAIGVQWSASCNQIAVVSVAFRASIQGE